MGYVRLRPASSLYYCVQPIWKQSRRWCGAFGIGRRRRGRRATVTARRRRLTRRGRRRRRRTLHARRRRLTRRGRRRRRRTLHARRCRRRLLRLRRRRPVAVSGALLFDMSRVSLESTPCFLSSTFLQLVYFGLRGVQSKKICSHPARISYPANSRHYCSLKSRATW